MPHGKVTDFITSKTLATFADSGGRWGIQSQIPRSYGDSGAFRGIRKGDNGGEFNRVSQTPFYGGRRYTLH